MRSLVISCAGLLTVLGTACVVPLGTDAGEEVEQQDSTIQADETFTYYIVTHPDYRRCAYPLCGGWFVKRVNRDRTQCADGRWDTECHVANLDLSALGVRTEDEARFREAFGAGHALVRGDLERVRSEVWDVNTLVASEAWVGQAESTPTATFYAVESNGVRCFTYPCATYRRDKLNANQHRNIADVDLAASGASQSKIDAGYEELWTSGILVAGTHRTVTGPGGSMPGLVASEFYTRLRPSAVDVACGGIAGIACAPGEVCDVDIPNACGGADLSGVCKTAPDFCTEQYDPVCGCDGKTYSNDCHRLAAEVQLDHAGECTGG